MCFISILHVFQSQEYQPRRFLKFIYSHPKFWVFGSKRQSLEWTAKAKAVYILSLTQFFILSALTLFLSFSNSGYFFFLFFGIFGFIPFYFIFAAWILFPLDIFLKKRIITKAKQKLGEFPDLKIIAITGSYGKTSTKEILFKTLGESFCVLIPEGNKNTPLGISELILSSLEKKHEILIVEMGAYIPGDIRALCEITPPHISILTGITAQHLERFHSIEHIIATKFEIFEMLPENGLALLDTSTQEVQRGLKMFPPKTSHIIQIAQDVPYEYKDQLSGTIFEIDGEKVETKLLACYLGKTLQICYEVGKFLGQTKQDFFSACRKLDFVPHRMQLIHNPQNNVYILDDSYNGNIQGILAICDLLKKAPFTGRKIVAAAGIVELGSESEKIHTQLGETFASCADMLLLLEGKIGNALASGAKKNKTPSCEIQMYSHSLALHADLKNILRSGDLIVFQNDIPDISLQ